MLGAAASSSIADELPSRRGIACGPATADEAVLLAAVAGSASPVIDDHSSPVGQGVDCANRDRVGRQRAAAAFGPDDHRGAARATSRIAAEAIAPLAGEHSIVVVHGNGPQVGLLSLQAEAYHGAEPYPLDVLDAGTQGMIGYLIQQELRSLLPSDRQVVTLLTMIVVDPADAAFANPTKFVGPVYPQADSRRAGGGERLDIPAGRAGLASGRALTRAAAASSRSSRSPGCSTGAPWSSAPAAAASRRCTRPPAPGELVGVEAVIDKDLASELVAEDVGADLLRHGHRRGRRLPRLGHAGAAAAGRGDAGDLSRHDFAAGSMGPKVEAASRFVTKTGRRAAIGGLADISGIVAGQRRHQRRGGGRVTPLARAPGRQPVTFPNRARYVYPRINFRYPIGQYRFAFGRAIHNSPRTQRSRMRTSGRRRIRSCRQCFVVSVRAASRPDDVRGRDSGAAAPARRCRRHPGLREDHVHGV